MSTAAHLFWCEVLAHRHRNASSTANSDLAVLLRYERKFLSGRGTAESLEFLRGLALASNAQAHDTLAELTAHHLGGNHV